MPIHIATDLTANQIKAYRIADNRVSQEAKWDDDLLALELADLDLENYDLGLTGFDDDELAALMAEAVTEGLVDQDQVPPEPETPVSVPSRLNKTSAVSRGTFILTLACNEEPT